MYAGYVRARVLMIRWFFSYYLDYYFLSYGEFKMRENNLRVKIPATAESSRSSGQSIILR